MSVAMPTAMPDPPLSKRFGTLAGSSTGSSIEPSKLGTHSTVLAPNSCSSRSAYRVSRDSVYRMAAKDFGSSVDPQLPCPSTRG
jgi:hypothetical protein